MMGFGEETAMIRTGTIGALILITAGCAPAANDRPPGAPAPAGGPAIVDTLWSAESVAGEAPAMGAPFLLMLDSGGHASGKSGCNNYSARYQLDGTKLTVHPPMIGTMMACPAAIMEQETTFRAVLESASTATIDTGGKLVVTAADGRALRFATKEERPGMGNHMPTSSHIVMRCGAEQLRVRLTSEGAEVVLEDGSTVTLPKLPAQAGETTETYTNGRMTLVRTTEAPHSFRFARGRMAFMTCAVAQN